MATGKRRMTWTLIAGMLVLLTWLAPVGAQAQGPGHGKGGRGGWGGGGGLMLGVPLHALNLTQDQKTQIQQILSTYRTNARPLIQQLRQAQGTLSDKLLAPGVVQPNDMQLQTQQISALRAQLLLLSAQATLDIRNLLTPDQLNTAATTKAQLKSLRGQIRQLMYPNAGTQP